MEVLASCGRVEEIWIRTTRFNGNCVALDGRFVLTEEV